MPGYSRTWSNLVPAGTDLANTIDDQIRNLREDINQRMDDLVDDWTDDPVVLQAVTTIPWPIITVKPTDQAVSTTTPTDDSALVLPVDAASSYDIRIIAMVTSPSSTPGIKYGLAVSTGVMNGVLTFLRRNAATLTVERDDDYVSGTVSDFHIGFTPSTLIVPMILEGVIHCTLAGNVTFQFAQNVSDVNSVTVKAGSVLMARKLAV